MFYADDPCFSCRSTKLSPVRRRSQLDEWPTTNTTCCNNFFFSFPFEGDNKDCRTPQPHVMSFFLFLSYLFLISPCPHSRVYLQYSIFVPPNNPITACGGASFPGYHSFPKWAISLFATFLSGTGGLPGNVHSSHIVLTLPIRFLGVGLRSEVRVFRDTPTRHIGLSRQKYSVLPQLIIQACRELKSKTSIKWQTSMLNLA